MPGAGLRRRVHAPRRDPPEPANVALLRAPPSRLRPAWPVPPSVKASCLTGRATSYPGGDSAGRPRSLDSCSCAADPRLLAGDRADRTAVDADVETIRERRNALCLKEVVSNRPPPGVASGAATMVRRKSRRKPLGDDLGGPRRVVGEDRADPRGVLAQEADRTPRRQLADDAQRHPLPDAERLPVGPTARAVRPQEHGPRLVPAVGRGGHLREDLGGAGRRVRRTRRGPVAMAERPTRCWARPGSGGKKTGKNPTDRGKKGTKKSLVTDGDGGPAGGGDRRGQRRGAEALEGDDRGDRGRAARPGGGGAELVPGQGV